MHKIFIVNEGFGIGKGYSNGIPIFRLGDEAVCVNPLCLSFKPLRYLPVLAKGAGHIAREKPDGQNGGTGEKVEKGLLFYRIETDGGYFAIVRKLDLLPIRYPNAADARFART
jgi:hypothetical protein